MCIGDTLQGDLQNKYLMQPQEKKMLKNCFKANNVLKLYDCIQI